MKFAFEGGEAQSHAMALMARTKLAAMGFAPPFRTTGIARGLPSDWKKHAALVIAHIEGYGIDVSREGCARARAEAEAELSNEPPRLASRMTSPFLNGAVIINEKGRLHEAHLVRIRLLG